MNFKFKVLYLITINIFFLFSCVRDKSNESIIDFDKNIRDIKTKVNKIDINENLGKIVVLDATHKYLIITNILAYDYGIYIYDINNFSYVSKGVKIGNGPNEITRIGQISLNEKDNTIWVPDLGRQTYNKYYISDIVKDSESSPKQIYKFNGSGMINQNVSFINDSIAIGNALHYYNDKNFSMDLSKFVFSNDNIKIDSFGYYHPKAVGQRSVDSYVNVSKDNSVIVRCYSRCNLLTVYDSNGNLIKNIYGKDWYNKNKKKSFYEKAIIYNDKIFASYNGDIGIVYDKYKRPQVNAPISLLVFNNKGDYEYKMNVGYGFSNFVIDNSNNRLIFYFEDREILFGYINL